jgi:glycerophosphoryl diester phosphodiesterase
MPKILGRRIKVAYRGWALAFALLALLAVLVACSEGPAHPESRSPFQIIAHRGASAYAPENTLPAFAKAMELGVTDVELDIQLSKDDVVILFHDKSLAEKTGQPGKVRDYDAADLVEMEIGSWFDRRHTRIETQFAGTRLNTLAELFDTFGDRLRYHVELKSADEALARLALEQIVAHQLEHRVQFTSFSFEQAERARSAAPHIPTGLLVRDAKRLRRDANAPEHAPVLPLQIRSVDRAVAAGFDLVGFPVEDLSRDIVAYAVDQGLEIRAWRILSDADMWRAITLGADGMTTNWPDRSIREIREIREIRGHERAAPSR